MLPLTPLSLSYPPHEYVHEKNESWTRCAHVGYHRLFEKTFGCHAWLSHRRLLQDFRCRFHLIADLAEDPPAEMTALKEAVERCFENAKLDANDAIELALFHHTLNRAREAYQVTTEQQARNQLLARMEGFKDLFCALGPGDLVLEKVFNHRTEKDPDFFRTCDTLTPILEKGKELLDNMLAKCPLLRHPFLQPAIEFGCLILAVKILEDYPIWNDDFLEALPHPLPPGFDGYFLAELELAILQSLDYKLNIGCG